MGISGISPLSLLLILLIVLVLFGTKRLRSIGQDLGAAVKNFRDGLENEAASQQTENSDQAILDKNHLHSSQEQEKEP